MVLEQTRYLLPEDGIPTSWYNVAADLPRRPIQQLHVVAQGEGQGVGLAVGKRCSEVQQLHGARSIGRPDRPLDAGLNGRRPRDVRCRAWRTDRVQVHIGQCRQQARFVGQRTARTDMTTFWSKGPFRESGSRPKCRA